MIKIYGKEECPFCVKAKKLCEDRGLEFTYYSIGEDLTVDELKQMFPGAVTVPQIKVHDYSVGGYNELVNYIEETGYNGTGYSMS